MAFRLPTFNLTANIFTSRGTPPAKPRLTVACQLRCPSTRSILISGDTLSATIDLPKGTDIRDIFNTSGADGVEVPAGTGRIYNVVLVEDVSRGFPNEHRRAWLLKKTPWPTPIP